jgi:CRP/FNR family cyclic AMP-dependent transcriptional regulator
MADDNKLTRLAEIPLFSKLSRKDLEIVAEMTDDLHISPGRVLAREGEAAYVAYIIISGQAAISVDGERVGTVGPGEMVGEMGLIDGGPRAATVTADGEMDVYVIEPGRFGPLLDRPGIAKALLQATIKRLRHADQLLHRH